MSIEKTPVPVNDLQKGMFVSDLDRDWLGTPFLLQGFEIATEEEINQLKTTCSYVFVDSKSLPVGFVPSQKIKPSTEDDRVEEGKATFSKSDAEQIKDFEEQVALARAIEIEIKNYISEIFTKNPNAPQVDVTAIRQVISPMVDSIAENPDAMVYLSHLKSHDNYGYNHSISSSIWAATLGRQLGLPKDQLTDLATGALLCDIGKLQVPLAILNKTGALDDEEFGVVKKHVNYSLAKLKDSPGINNRILMTVAYHHERESGNGYPKGLKGESIPLFAKIAAIADCYDAMISKRVHCDAISPNKAIHKLYGFRGTDFQAELVEEFIKVLGVYPVGSIVELSDGWVGVVIKVNSSQRLKPKLMLILDHNKNPIHPMKILDLKNDTKGQDGNLVIIKKGLPVDAYGINARELFL